MDWVWFVWLYGTVILQQSRVQKEDEPKYRLFAVMTQDSVELKHLTGHE